MKRVRSTVWAALTMAAVTWAAPGVALGPSKAPAESEAMTDKARELYNEGRALFADSEWDKAHASFLAAWSLKKHWQIAGMLGLCEVRMDRFREAAEHLAFSIRTGAGNASQEEMKKLREALDRAKRKVGTVRVQVDTDNAEVRINDRVVGKAPLFDSLFVEPGDHVLRARTHEHASSEVKVSVQAGGMKEVLLRVDQVISEGEQGAGAPGSVSKNGTADVTTQPVDDGRSLTPAIIGGAMAAVGLGIGVGFTLSANGKESDRDDAVDALGGSNACGAGTPFQNECAEIRDLDDAASSRRKVALGGFIVGGTALAGTAAYLLWPSGEDDQHASRWTPVVGPDGGGIQWVGEF